MRSATTIAFGLGIAVALAALSTPGSAAPPFLVADLNESRSEGVFVRRGLYGKAEQIRFGDHALFTLTDGIHGMELWLSDGTAGGTALVRDICPGSCSSHPADFVVFQGLAYFAADDGAHGIELWRTDGTAAGTVLVADGVPGLPGSSPESLVALETLLLYRGSDETGHELWRSDGTEKGTYRLADLRVGGEGSYPTALTSNGSLVLFTADDGVHGGELWRSDGTPAGTHVIDLQPGPESGLHLHAEERLSLAGATFLFEVRDGQSHLWRSDGTAHGTYELAVLSAAWSGMASLGDRVAVVGGDEVWVTDGTAAGTARVARLDGLASPLVTWNHLAVGPRMYFVAYRPDRELWITDGTSEGTRLVVSLPDTFFEPGVPPSFAGAFGELALFYEGIDPHALEPWVSDGTVAGTHRIAPGSDGGADYWNWFDGLHAVVCLPELCLARLEDDDGDLELWKVDPTAGTVERVAEINSQSTSLAEWKVAGLRIEARRLLAAAGERVVVLAGDDAGALRLWTSDGTPAGTASLAEVGTLTSDLPSGVVSNGQRALLPVWGRESGLWSSDGTGEGTWQMSVPSLASSVLRVGSRLVLDGESIYVTDGTDASSEVLLTSPAGAGLVMGDEQRVFLIEGVRLWSSDGSPEGTAPVVGAVLPAWPATWQATSAAGRILFTGEDAGGVEPWVYDGVAPARRLLDLHPGPAASIDTTLDLYNATEPGRKLASLGDRAVLLVDDGATGEEPWISDGTEVGTLRLADVLPGPSSSHPAQLTVASDRAYFVADDGIHGRELWSTDGTTEGTRLVFDIVPGAGSSVPRNLTAVDRWLLFAAVDPVHGVEAWVTDGTPEATFRLGDVAPGRLSASPAHFTAAGDLVFFAANDNTTGFELWAVPRTALDAAVTDFHTVSPCRLYDSRKTTPLDSVPRRLPVAGRCGIPTTARAIAANVTALQSTAAGSVRTAAAFAPHAWHQVAPFPAGTARAQQAILRLGFGEVELAAELPDGHATDVIVDVAGWFE